MGIILSLAAPQNFSATQNIWQNKIATFGILAPLAFILLQALQVIVAPISHYGVGMLGGFLYGPYLGTLLNWIGRIIGHVGAFFIARLAGRGIAEKYVDPDTLKQYDKYLSNKSFVLFLCYFLPVFPDDEMSYLTGLSKMPLKQFLTANIFGHIGGSLGLAYIGSGIDIRDPLLWILSGITLIGFLLILRLIKVVK